MKRLSMLLMGVVAVFAVASMAASSAFASGPTLLFLSGEGSTILLITNETTVATELQSSVSTLHGEGVLTELTLLQEPSGATGIYLALFINVEEAAGNKCHTPGDSEAKGEVLLGNNSLEPGITSTSPLEVGLAFLVNEFTIECNAGALKITIKGSDLGSVSTINGEDTALKGGLQCSSTKGKPVKTSYTNTAGTAKTAKLEVTAAKKTAEGCELVGTSGAEVTFGLESTSSSKMVEVMG